MVDYFNGRDGNERPKYGSFRELAEAMRQEVYRQMSGGQESTKNVAATAGKLGGKLAGNETGEEGVAQVAYFPPPLGGNFRNATRNTTIYIVGDVPTRGGVKSFVHPVPPGGRDARNFDADFFKVDGTWFKVGGLGVGGRMVVVKDGPKFEIEGAFEKAESSEISGCERMLQDYLGNKGGI